MTTPSRRGEAMQRKPILMPPEMISRIEQMARGRKVSFAKIVREAVEAFEETPSDADAALLDALAETMIRTSRDVASKIEAMEARLDETHAMLERS